MNTRQVKMFIGTIVSLGTTAYSLGGSAERFYRDLESGVGLAIGTLGAVTAYCQDVFIHKFSVSASLSSVGAVLGNVFKYVSCTFVSSLIGLASGVATVQAFYYTANVSFSTLVAGALVIGAVPAISAAVSSDIAGAVGNLLSRSCREGDANQSVVSSNGIFSHSHSLRSKIKEGATIGFLAGGLARTVGFKEGVVGGVLGGMLSKTIEHMLQRKGYSEVFSGFSALFLTSLIDLGGLHSFGTTSKALIPYTQSENIYFHHLVFYTALIIGMQGLSQYRRKAIPNESNQEEYQPGAALGMKR